jgi:hypothetical protein
MGALILLTILVTTVWMGIDSAKRDWSHSRFANATWQWVVGGLGLWIVAFPAYLITRGRAPLKTVPAIAAAFPPAAAPEGWAAPIASRSVAPPSASVQPPVSPPARSAEGDDEGRAPSR